jgi:hypothetical protein
MKFDITDKRTLSKKASNTNLNVGHQDSKKIARIRTKYAHNRASESRTVVDRLILSSTH